MTGLLLLSSAACSSAYYGAMEKVGYHKREILVARVDDARDAQEDARDQFVSALEQFRSVVAFDGGDLEATYDKLSRELGRSEDRAEEVRNRIRSVENVAEALFDEWEAELADYRNEDLRAKSRRSLAEARRRYQKLISAMHRAEARIEPALEPLQDQVLYLKHNLNAKAIASLQGEAVSIETDIESLIRALEASIAEADAFIASKGL